MKDNAAVRRHEVPFSGGRTRSAPLTWAQRTTWDDIQYFAPEVKGFAFVKSVVRLPATTDPAGVVAALGLLVNRHESLRTLVRTDGSGNSVQQVLGEGILRVEVVETGRATAEEVADVVAAQWDRVSATAMDHETRIPFRPVVVVHETLPAAVVLCVSHAVADTHAVMLLGEELRNIVAADAAGLPAPAPAAAMHQVDLAVLEQSPEGARLNSAALRYYAHQLQEFPETMFGVSRPGEGLRYLRAELRSRSMPPALETIAERHRSSTSTVLLAVSVALLHGLTGSRRCGINLVSGNRSAKELRRAVATLSQTVPALISWPSDSFADLLRATAIASMRAYRHGRFDTGSAAGLVRDEERRRGRALDLGCRFNDLRAPGRRRDDGPRAERGEARFSWKDGTDSDKITFFLDVAGDAEEIQVYLLADTHRISRTWMREFLVGLDDVLSRLAEKEMTVREIVDTVAFSAPGPGHP